MKTDLLVKPTPCRFHKETKEKLRRISARFQLRPAEVIRRAVDQALDEWEQTGELVVKAKRR